MFRTKCSGRIRIRDQKVPPSQPSHTRLQPGLCLYPGAGSPFYSLIVVKLVEAGLVEDLVNVLRLVSWALRITIVPLELYVTGLGLAPIHTVWDGSSFLLAAEFRPNELNGSGVY